MYSISYYLCGVKTKKNYLDEVFNHSSCTSFSFKYTAAAYTFIVIMK